MSAASSPKRRAASTTTKSEKRGIYGEATSDEVHALRDEGIEFHPLPMLPEDHN